MPRLGRRAPAQRETLYAFEAIDPLRRRVYCTDSRWNDRIAPAHPEIAELQQQICAAIAQPTSTRVTHAGGRQRRSYYGRGPSPPLATGEGLEVVCTDEGSVVTVRLAIVPAEGAP
jgi:hypothetical protein